MNNERCTCGDMTVSYHPDENQHEPNCHECYFSDREDVPGPEWDEDGNYLPAEGDSLTDLTDDVWQDDLPF